MFALPGCQKADEIEHYEVVKPEVLQKELYHDSPSAGGASAAVARQDRMLAAIVPHGEKFWFFKVVGPDGAVVENQKSFVTFLNSIKFDSADDAPPQWSLPVGWTQKPGSEMRFATIVMTGGAASLDLAVSSLPKTEGDNKAQLEKSLLENVNRWRGQFRLRPVGPERLADELHKFKIADTTAYLIAITGKYQAGGMAGAPFAGGPANTAAGSGGEKSLPAGHPPIDAASTGDAGAAPPSDLKFHAPDGWKVGQTTGFSSASFVVRDGARKAQITATPLDGDLTPDSLLANVNRWRRQIGLDPTDQPALAAIVKKILIGGEQASYVALAGPESAILGAITSHAGRLWFFKLQGDKQLAEREKSNFESFVKSIKFADDGSK